jgi:hypothetical protein
MDYEFRFFRGPTFEVLHMTALDSDVLALERARAYLRLSSEYSHVEVRRGFYYMRRITSDRIPGELAS